MRKRNREINVFNLSMLDVISSAMAAFLIIMVVLLPYYDRMPMEYVAELKEKLAVAVNRAQAAEQEARTVQAEADATREQLEQALRRIEALEKKDLDVMIVLDTTGSMGDEIQSLQTSIKDLVRILDALTTTLRVGVVAYRDADSIKQEYVTLPFPLRDIDDPGQSALERFIDALDTDGGQTHEEAVYEGLEAAYNQSWRRDADGVIVVIGDAQAHQRQVQATFDLAARFRARSERNRVSTISARVDPDARRRFNAGPRDEAFFKDLARHGGGVHTPSSGPLLSGIVVSIFK